MADSSYGYRFLLVGLIVATNGFFAAAEASLLSARKSRIQQLADEGDTGAKAALQLLDNPERLLSVVQVGVTLASLGLGWAGEETIHQLLLSWMQPLIVPWTASIVPVFALVLSFGLMTYMHVVIGEVVPKNIAIETADRFAVLVAPILLVFGRIAGPLVTIIERSSKRISRQLGLRGEAEGGGGHTVEELKFIVSLSQEEGKIQKFQQLAIHHLLELEDYSARKIMVPRSTMVAVPLDISLEELLVLLNEHQFSRLPVYENSPDQIVGIVHLKDLIHVLMQRGGMTRFHLKNVMRRPIFVPETRSLSDLIDVFREHNTHMAVVVDEHGSTIGVVTLEDVLEQVFGEIEDEHDILRPKQDRHAAALELEGTINIPDLANQYGVALPTDGGFETLAGYLLSKIGDLPQEGVVLEDDGRRFTILQMERNRIARVRIERLEVASTAPEMHAAIRAELIAHSEPGKLPIMQRFFKDTLDAYCTYTTHVRNIARTHGGEFAAWPESQRKDLTQALWASGKFEEGGVAIQLYARMRRKCGRAEWKLFGQWLGREIRNWAHCDALCADVLGPMLIAHPEWISELNAWAVSKPLYKRRAALVTPLKGVRQGLFVSELQDLVTALAADREDLIKKAVVWARKELAK